MDSNAFLLSFGMHPEDFERTEGPIQSDDGFLFEAWEARRRDLACTNPACKSGRYKIHNRYTAQVRLRSELLKTEVLICHRIRYVCLDCEKTFTAPVRGAMAGNDIAQTMIDAAYGYKSFERFRKRFLLMRWNGKRKKKAALSDG